MLDLDNKLEDPNNLTKEQADINYVLVAAEMDLVNLTAGRYADNQQGLSVSAMSACRLIHQFGAYTGGFSDMRSTALNDSWQWAYMGVLKNANFVIDKAEELGGRNYHSGMARVMKAYTMATLVDYFGDIPYSEALQGAEEFDPAADSGEEVYSAALTILDEAIADFQNEPSTYPEDLFYNNNGSKWIKLANTIKLKMYLNRRLVDASGSATAINSIINSGNYISSLDDDFQFQFSSVDANPDSRHPDFIDNYGAGGAGSYFMSNYLIYLMKDSKTNRDPRLRYYMYRQTDADPSGDDLPCATKDYDYCYLGEGYWGRDHGDDDGVPNDNLDRTTWGVYPVGGAFDNDNFVSVPNNQGAQGAGIYPFMLSSWVNFMIAEYHLTLGNPADAETYYNNGVSQSIAKVLDFGAEQAAGSPYQLDMTSTEVTDYLAEAASLYSNAAAADRLDVVAREYFISLFGNGIELYNFYRRTGLPSDIQSPVRLIGAFPRSYQYPQDLINRNENFTQHSVTQTVFWDNNSTNLN